jgi:hypothetical protein
MESYCDQLILTTICNSCSQRATYFIGNASYKNQRKNNNYLTRFLTRLKSAIHHKHESVSYSTNSTLSENYERMNISDMETQNPPEVDMIAEHYSEDSACEAEIDSSVIQVFKVKFFGHNFILDGRGSRF